MAHAASAALQEVARKLNFGGQLPSIGQAKAAIVSAQGAIREGMDAAGKLPGALKAKLLGLTYTEATAKKALQAILSDLGLQAKRLTGPDNAAAPSGTWADAKKACLRAYQELFTVKETAAYEQGVSFAGELADLERNLKEGVPILKAAVKKGIKAVKTIEGVAGDVAEGAVWAILKPLLPILLMLVVLIYVLGKTEAGKAAIAVGKKRLA